MRPKGKPKPSPAVKIGMGAFLTAMLLSVFDLRLIAVPLFMFIMICAMAPFFPRYGFFLPVISRGAGKAKAVGLTFDDGPDPRTTPGLLRLLDENQVTATFFVTGKRARAYPALIEAILASGHSIGNHSHTHDNLIMLKGRQALKLEIEKTQRVLGDFGIRPLAFRPPVGVTSPLLNQVLAAMGLYAVTFSRRALDGGNRFIRRLSARILKRLKPGDIILLHDVCPKHDELVHVWLQEVQSILWGIQRRGWTVMDLSTLIGRPVMQVIQDPGIPAVLDQALIHRR